MKKSKRYIKKQNNKPLINKKVLAKVIRESNICKHAIKELKLALEKKQENLNDKKERGRTCNGSFERKTKTRPLDDIDIMICLNADGWSYFENSVDDITLRPPSNYSGRLK